MDRASLFFLTKGIVTQYFSLLITSLAICKSIFQRFVITVETSLVFIISKARLSFMERKKKKKKQDRYFVPSKPPLRSTNFKVAGILSRTSQLYFGCIIFWNLFFCSFRIPEMKHSC